LALPRAWGGSCGAIGILGGGAGGAVGEGVVAAREFSGGGHGGRALLR